MKKSLLLKFLKISHNSGDFFELILEGIRAEFFEIFGRIAVESKEALLHESLADDLKKILEKFLKEFQQKFLNICTNSSAKLLLNS